MSKLVLHNAVRLKRALLNGRLLWCKLSYGLVLKELMYCQPRFTSSFFGRWPFFFHHWTHSFEYEQTFFFVYFKIAPMSTKLVRAVKSWEFVGSIHKAHQSLLFSSGIKGQKLKILIRWAPNKIHQAPLSGGQRYMC